MTILDLERASWALGVFIDRLEKTSPSFPELMEFKHAYLRLHHCLVKATRRSHRESRLTRAALMAQPDDCLIVPSFLPCHKRPLQRRQLPCTCPDDICHCAQLLQCDLEEGILSFYHDL